MADLRINVSDIVRDNQNRNARTNESLTARIQRLEEDNQALRRLMASVLVALEDAGIMQVSATVPA